MRISNCDGVNITVCSPECKIGVHVLHWSDEIRDFELSLIKS